LIARFGPDGMQALLLALAERLKEESFAMARELPSNRSAILGPRSGTSRNADLAPQPLHVHAPDISWDVAPDGVIAKLAVLHFVERGVLAPALIEDAIERRDQASAVGAVLAMQQHRPLPPSPAQGLQRTDDILSLDMPGVNGEAYQPQIEPARERPVRVIGAQADHRAQAVLRREVLEALGIGLRAAKEIVVDEV